MKPWKVFATYPTCFSRCVDSHVDRSSAECHAQKLRRLLGNQIAIRVVWDDQP